MSRQLIPVERVQCGLYIELPLKWHEHPFLLSRFLLKDNKQLATLQSLGLKEVWYYPEKSAIQPLFVPAVDAPAQPFNDMAVQHTVDHAWEEKKGRLDRLKQRRAEIVKVEKQFAVVVSQVKGSLRKMNQHPAQAIDESTDMVCSMVDSLLNDEGALLHLMSPDAEDTGLYYHAVNVSVLSMLLAKALKLPREQIEVIGCGALLHDIGKMKLSSALVEKTAPLTAAEEKSLRQHARLGAEMLRKFGRLPQEVALIAEQHHETVNGTGYPAQLQDKQMTLGARIVAIVNAYDNLCNHADIEKSLTPHEALSLMFAKQAPLYDKTVLQCLVRLLGVYPPGTVVELSDGSLGIVISINPRELLWPSVLVYDADVPKHQAVIVDLAEDKALTIARSIRPRALKPEVYAYLSPKERISYFFNQGDRAGS